MKDVRTVAAMIAVVRTVAGLLAVALLVVGFVVGPVGTILGLGTGGALMVLLFVDDGNR